MNEQQRDPAFVITDLNKESGTVTVKINKGILGVMANQLKRTKKETTIKNEDGTTAVRVVKGAGIIKKLGHVLSEGGDFLYGDSNDPPDLNKI